MKILFLLLALTSLARAWILFKNADEMMNLRWVNVGFIAKEGLPISLWGIKIPGLEAFFLPEQHQTFLGPRVWISMNERIAGLEAACMDLTTAGERGKKKSYINFETYLVDFFCSSDLGWLVITMETNNLEFSIESEMIFFGWVL